MSMKTIYISGPMSGLPEFNYPEFNKWAKVWRERGYRVINPAEHPLQDYRDMLALDLKLIREECTDVFFLKGWRGDGAVGSFAEYGLAKWLGLKLHFEVCER